MSSTLVEAAIAKAQDAVTADSAGDFEKAIELYKESIDLIKRGMQTPHGDDVVDKAVLQRYLKLYTDRVFKLQEHLTVPAAAKADSLDPLEQAMGTFSLSDLDEIAQRTPPSAPPKEEWRRTFWLMRVLRSSMHRGGFLSPDGKVYVPKRLWVQKGAKFTALLAKSECAECLVNELRQVSSVDYRQPRLVSRELERLVDILDVQQAALSRLLPFIPEPPETGKRGEPSAMGKMTERVKGLAKSLDKTAARLGSMPTKCADPFEYIQTLVDLFDAAAFVEKWIEHYEMSQVIAHVLAMRPTEAVEQDQIINKLRRTTRFLYEVVCTFVVHDLDALLQRHFRKAAAAFAKLTDSRV